MDEKIIQNTLQVFWAGRGHDLIIPNFYLTYESDLLSVTKSGFIHEFEIKCTKSDFKRDFKNKSDKHFYLKAALEKEQIKVVRYQHMVANYFWFVAPENLLDINDIPKYSGFIEISENDFGPWCREQRRAPRLHSDKITEPITTRIYRGLMFRYWKMRKEIEHATN